MIAQAGESLYVGQQGRFFAQVSAAREELAGLGAPLLYRERRSTTTPAGRRLRRRAFGRRRHRHARRRAQHRRAGRPLGAPLRAVSGRIRRRRVRRLGCRDRRGGNAVLRGSGRALTSRWSTPLSSSDETTTACERGPLTIDTSGLTVAGRRVLQVVADSEYTALFRRQYEALLRGEPGATLDEGRQAVAACAPSTVRLRGRTGGAPPTWRRSLSRIVRVIFTNPGACSRPPRKRTSSETPAPGGRPGVQRTSPGAITSTAFCAASAVGRLPIARGKIS